MCDPSLWSGATMAALASPLLLGLLHLMHHTSAGESEDHIGGVAKTYAGPEFNAFDCYQDPSPVRYQLPNACTDKTGRPLYSSTAKYTKHTVNLYQDPCTLETAEEPALNRVNIFMFITKLHSIIQVILGAVAYEIFDKCIFFNN